MNNYIVWCPELNQTRENGGRFSAEDHESAAIWWAFSEQIGNRHDRTLKVYVAKPSQRPKCFLVGRRESDGVMCAVLTKDE